MFDNAKPAEVALATEEKETPAVSLTEKTPDKTVSEDDKTPKSEGEVKGKVEEEKPFHEHSRFKELVAQKKEWKTKYESLADEVAEIKSQLSKKEADKIPQFETIEQLQGFLERDYPKLVRKQIEDETKSVKQKEEQESKTYQKVVDEQIEDLKDEGEEFDEKELIKFAFENEIVSLPKALKLMRKEVKDEEAAQIAARKKDSGLKSGTSGDYTAPVVFQPGRSVYDAVREVKKQLKN